MIQIVKLYRHVFTKNGRYIGIAPTYEVWQLDAGFSKSDWRRVK